MSGHDSRYFIVNETVGYQAANLLRPTGKRKDATLTAELDEIVFNNSKQLCPFALFYFKR